MIFSPCTPSLDFTLRTDECPEEKKLEKAEGYSKHQSAHSHFPEPCQHPEQDYFWKQSLLAMDPAQERKGCGLDSFRTLRNFPTSKIIFNYQLPALTTLLNRASSA